MRAMDYWTFAARTADASVTELDAAPPEGIHHHYCRLAVVTFPDTVLDCRVFWPPQFGGDSCACSVCVTPDSHNSGALTIQMAVDQVREQGGTICLAAGEYALGSTPVLMDGMRSVRMVGQGWQTILSYTGAGAAIGVRNSLGVTLEDFTVLTPPRSDLADRAVGGGPAFHLRHNVGITIRRCVALQFGSRGGGNPAIGVEGLLLGAVVEENAMLAPSGIASMIEADPNQERMAYALVANLVVRDNVMVCGRSAVRFPDWSLHLSDMRITGNTILIVPGGGSEGAVVTTGAAGPGSRLAVDGNLIYAAGNGVVTGIDHTRIRDNELTWFGTDEDGNQPTTGSGVVVTQGLRPDRVDDCRIEGNRIDRAPEAGIALRQRLGAARIAGNSVLRAGRAAIAMAAESGAGEIAVVDNRFEDIMPAFMGDGESAVAVHLIGIDRLTFSRNTVRAVAQRAVETPGQAAVFMQGCRDALLAGNQLTDIGPIEGFRETMAILASQPLASLHITDSVIVRSQDGPQEQDATSWYAIRILAGISESPPLTHRRRLNYPLFVRTEDTVFAVDAFRIRTVADGLDQVLHIQGNSITAWGQSPAVQAILDGSCLFTGNTCHLQGQSGANAVVQIAAQRIAVSNNVVRRPSEQDAIQLQGKAFTVVGNITFGNIRINGSPLPPPWQDLNVLSS